MVLLKKNLEHELKCHVAKLYTHANHFYAHIQKYQQGGVYRV